MKTVILNYGNGDLSIDRPRSRVLHHRGRCRPKHPLQTTPSRQSLPNRANPPHNLTIFQLNQKWIQILAKIAFLSWVRVVSIGCFVSDRHGSTSSLLTNTPLPSLEAQSAPKVPILTEQHLTAPQKIPFQHLVTNSLGRSRPWAQYMNNHGLTFKQTSTNRLNPASWPKL